MKSIVVFFTVCMLAMQTFAANTENYVAGKDYEVLQTQVPTRNKNKVEVVEVFWYGCPHCFDFEPMLQAWKTKLPDYADFYQMPAMWSATMKLHAQGFYVAKSLGILDKIHEPFFNALNLEKKKINDQDGLAIFFSRFNVDRATFNKTFDSFGVNSQVSLAESRAVSYHIQGTPELIVNGKYRVSSTMAGSQPNMLKIAAFLVEKEGAELAKK